jgi:PAS domain S-box-containing protein
MEARRMPFGTEIEKGSARPRILIVDDYPANLLALEAVLEPLGLDLVTCKSGEEALGRLLKNEFALVLLDVEMPGLDGIKTARLIKDGSRTRDLPIIFITALSRDESQVFRAYSQGAVDYIFKPFDPDILRSKVSVFVQLFQQKEKIKGQARLLREKELEAQEKRTERRIKNLIDAMPIAVWATRTGGEVYYANRKWIAYSGLGADASGTFGLRAAHPDDAERVRSLWLQAGAQGKELETEYRLRRASDGEYRWHLLRAVPELGEDSGVTGWIANAVDVEEHRRSEEARASLLLKEQRALEQARAASRMKDEFLATVSHELRTPLTAILGWTRIIRSGKLDPTKLQKGLDAIERNGRAQVAIIDDILDVSRIITGKLRLEMSAMDLPALIRTALDTVRPAADAKEIGIDLRIDLPRASYSGDPDRLTQIVWNLLSNAIKFTPKGGEVTITLAQVASHLELSVKDTGQGIPADFLPHVFDRFRQADGTSTRRHGGLGLGLAIVRHLVELHGGTVHADSPGEGQGSAFTVCLPVRAVQADSTAASIDGATRRTTIPPPHEQTLLGLTVLVVDDELDARELIATVLEDAGARTLSATTANEALEFLRRDKPDVLLSDIGLPVEDGYALMSRVRALPPEQGGLTPAAALTAYSRAEDARRAISAGFQRHVPKPVEPDVLVSQVAALAGR